MKGSGFYNDYSKAQLKAAELGVELLLPVIKTVTTFSFSEENGLAVCDYGGSEGRNSLLVLSKLVKQFRENVGSKIPVTIYLEDVPQNDWTSVFNTCTPTSYDDSNIFVCGIGRSFVQQVLPLRSIHIAWSSSAFQWLSSPIPPAPHHVIPQANPEIKEIVATLAAQEWENIVKARSSELKIGGKFAAVITGTDEYGNYGAMGIYGGLNTAWKELLSDGTITKEEFNKKVHVYLRTEKEILAPLSKYGFKVDICKCLVISNPYWDIFQSTNDKTKFTGDLTKMTRAWSEPSMKAMINKERPDKERQEIVEKLYSNLEKWFAAHCSDPGFGDVLVSRCIVLGATLSHDPINQ